MKCNGTVEEVAKMIAALNAVAVPDSSEVVIGIPSLHLAGAKSNLQGAIKATFSLQAVCFNAHQSWQLRVAHLNSMLVMSFNCYVM